MRFLPLVALLFIYAPASAKPLDTWHLLTVARGGTVSLIKNLSKEACEFAMNRALGRPATPEEKDAEAKNTAAMWERARKVCEEKPDAFDRKDGNLVRCEKGVALGITYGTVLTGSSSIDRAECFQ